MVTGLQAPLLLEREEQLRRLADCLRAASDGAGAALALAGEPGAGKTELLRRARALAEDGGLQVAWARGAELERDYPLGVARQLLVPLATATPELLDGAARGARALTLEADDALLPDPHSLAFAMHALLAEATALRPLAIIVDDAHWADALSLRWLAQVARDLAASPLALIVGMRHADPAATPELRELRAVPQLAELPVPLLTPAGTAELVRTDAPDADDDFCAACADATGGNPLLTRALVAGLKNEGVAPNVEAVARMQAAPPPTVGESVMVRVGRLGTDATHLAQAVAILERDVALVDAAALAGLAPDAAAALADDLAACGVFAVARRISFVHPVMRAAVYDDIPSARRARLHRQAAARLADGGATVERVAAHAALADPAGDAATVESLRLAARAALARGAGDVAAALLARALDEPPPAESRIAVALEHVLAEDVAGLPPRPLCARLLDLARQAVDARVAAEGLHRASLLPVRADMINEALQVIDETLARLPDEAGEQRLALEWASLQMTGNDAALRPRGAARVGRLAPSLRGDSALGRRLLRECAWWYATGHGTRDDVDDLIRRAGPITGAGLEGAEEELSLLQSCLLVERWDAAREHDERALDLARRAGAIFWILNVLCYRSMLEQRVGDLYVAEAEIAAATELSVGMPLHPIFVAFEAAIALDRGKLDRAREFYDAAAPGVAALPDTMIPRMVGDLALARVELALIDAQLALERLERVDARLGPAGIRSIWGSWRTTMALALAQLGQHEQARALAGAEAEAAGRVPAPLTAADARLAAALARERPAPDELAAVVSAMRAAGGRLDLARALVEHGAALRRSGARRESREPLAEALELAARCGAEGVAERARTELRAAGARPRREMRSGLDALTPSELRVAQLAAEGASNPEIAQALFVTRKTVETHMGRILSKLDVTSRDQIAAAVTR